MGERHLPKGLPHCDTGTTRDETLLARKGQDAKSQSKPVEPLHSLATYFCFVLIFPHLVFIFIILIPNLFLLKFSPLTLIAKLL